MGEFSKDKQINPIQALVYICTIFLCLLMSINSTYILYLTNIVINNGILAALQSELGMQ